MTQTLSARGLETDKRDVYEFWNAASCGETLLMKGDTLRAQFVNQMKTRYAWEPEILEFAQFETHRGETVLEIGVGLGADHQRWAEAGTQLFGIDLTDRAIANTRARLECFGLKSDLRVADAESLPFDAGKFDVVYSWGVLLYCPNVEKAIEEVRRVLKPGGVALIMLYHRYSFVGYMLWTRYALMRLQFWRSLDDIYFNYLESKGTRVFSTDEARAIFSNYRETDISVHLCHGDLLCSDAGQRHRGILLSVAKRIWPRAFIRRFLPSHGLFMKIRATK